MLHVILKALVLISTQLIIHTRWKSSPNRNKNKKNFLLRPRISSLFVVWNVRFFKLTKFILFAKFKYRRIIRELRSLRPPVLRFIVQIVSLMAQTYPNEILHKLLSVISVVLSSYLMKINCFLQCITFFIVSLCFPFSCNRDVVTLKDFIKVPVKILIYSVEIAPCVKDKFQNAWWQCQRKIVHKNTKYL